MDKVVLTIDHYAQIVCCTKRERDNLLKELAKGTFVLVWNEETHSWTLVPKE